jgi:hypothetical protein
LTREGYTTCNDRTRLSSTKLLPSIFQHTKHLVDGVAAAKVLLDVQGTRGLPGVVLVREDASLVTNRRLDLCDSNLLGLRAGNSKTVGVTGAGPSDLGDVGTLLGGLGADLGGLSELLDGEVTSHVGGDGAGEVGVDLASEDVDVVAESGTVLLPGADGLGGGNGNVLGETSALESLADVVDVAAEGGGVGVAVEDGLVTDDDHGDTLLGGVALDGLELLVGVVGEGSLATGTATLEEDAVDDLEAVFLALGNNRLENTAVGAVGADGGEAHLGDVLDILLDLVGSLALAVGGIGSVGHGPLVAVGDDAATGAVATGRLGLVSRLGAARSRSRLGVDRLGGSWGVHLRRLRLLRLGSRRVLCRLRDLRLGGSRRVNLCRLAWGWGRSGGRSVDGRLGLLLSAGGRSLGRVSGGRDDDGGIDGRLGLLLLSAGGRSLGCVSGLDPGGVGDDGGHWRDVSIKCSRHVRRLKRESSVLLKPSQF